MERSWDSIDKEFEPSLSGAFNQQYSGQSRVLLKLFAPFNPRFSERPKKVRGNLTSRSFFSVACLDLHRHENVQLDLNSIRDIFQ